MGASTMLGITMEESGVSKIIALRLDQDIKVGAKVDAPDENFIEEDVPPEEGTYIPPRPPKRIYNPDGKQVIIDTMSCAMSSSDLNLHIMLKRVEISGVNITVKDYGYVHTSGKSITSASKTDYVYITRVEGYK
jgi:hypothetical protein